VVQNRTPHDAADEGSVLLQRAVGCRPAEATMTDDLPFKVVRSNGHDEMSAVENEADD
jgi:hypothetical protein